MFRAFFYVPLNGARGGGGGGGGVTPSYDGLYREAPPERGTFFRLQEYERVGKSVIWVCERSWKGPKRANRGILWLYKVEKTLYFCG